MVAPRNASPAMPRQEAAADKVTLPKRGEGGMRSSPRTPSRRGPSGLIGHHLLPLVGLMLLAACGEGEKQQAAAPQAPPPTVTVAPVRSKEVTPAYEFIGRVQAVDAVD